MPPGEKKDGEGFTQVSSRKKNKVGGQQKTMRENQGKMVTNNNPFQILEEKGEDVKE